MLLFHFKSSFSSQDIEIIVFLSFKSFRKNGLMRKIRLISKFMTSQPGQQTIKIHMLTNISRSKDNQTMKLDQFVEYSKKNIFRQKTCRK